MEYNFKIKEEKLKEVAERYGLELKKVEDKKDAGFFLGGKKLSEDDLVVMLTNPGKLNGFANTNLTESDAKLLELIHLIAIDYDGMDGSIEGMKRLVDEMNDMVVAILDGESKEYLEKLR